MIAIICLSADFWRVWQMDLSNSAVFQPHPPSAIADFFLANGVSSQNFVPAYEIVNEQLWVS